MDTKKTNLSQYEGSTVPNGAGKRIAIVVADWNKDITERLLQGAKDTLIENEVHKDDILVVNVPGSYELPSAANHLLAGPDRWDAVICLGCVIQGETRHFDFICDAVAQGLVNVSLRHDKPVIFGVLTTGNKQQAIERSGGNHGNKGVEAAITALNMCQMFSLL